MMYGAVRALLAPPARPRLSLSGKQAGSWGRPDGKAQLATCRRPQTPQARLSGRKLKYSAANKTGLLTQKEKKKNPTHSPGHPDQCNKQRKECAISSKDTDTLRVSRMCQIVSQGHILILVGSVCLYFFIELFAHKLCVR